MNAVRVLVCDDNAVIRSGLIALLELDPCVQVVGEASEGAEALQLARVERPDVVLLDVRMPGSDGLSVVEELAGITKVLMLTYSSAEDDVSRALGRGATGYLVHGEFDPQALSDAVRATAAGRSVLAPAATAVLVSRLNDHLREANAAQGDPTGLNDVGTAAQAPDELLTPREVDIVRLLVKGCRNSEIAGTLFLSEKTVKNHLSRIFVKVGVSSRSQLQAYWVDRDRDEGPYSG